MGCEHHKACGDCFSGEHVGRLEEDIAARDKAWARLVRATVDERDAAVADEQEQPGAGKWFLRSHGEVVAAKQALRAIGVPVDALLEGP